MDRQSLTRRFLERFALIAFALYHVPLFLNNYPSLGGGGFDDKGLSAAWGRVFTPPGIWVARHVFGMGGPMESASLGDNGDVGEEFGRLLIAVVTGIVGAAVWTFADRRKLRERGTEETLRVLLRYSIALGITSYGIAKILPMQFSEIRVATLETRVGDLSPMGLLWTFMQYSRPYAFLGGALEMLAVFLLCFRRTATLGALVTLAVMVNVAAMNLAYGVPVKLYAIMTVLSAAVLVLYDARRMLAVFVTNQAVAPATLSSFFHDWIPTPTRWGIKIALVGSVIVSSVVAMRSAIASNVASPMDGAWEVTSFERDGAVASADSVQWRRIIMQGNGLSIRLASDKRMFCQRVSSPGLATIALNCGQGSKGVLRMTVQAGELSLEGTFDESPLRVSARHVSRDEYQLMKSRFRWISDR